MTNLCFELDTFPFWATFWAQHVKMLKNSV